MLIVDVPQLVFTHPSVDSYDNWDDIWTDPRTDDSSMYNSNRTGVFAQASPRSVMGVFLRSNQPMF